MYIIICNNLKAATNVEYIGPFTDHKHAHKYIYNNDMQGLAIVVQLAHSGDTMDYDLVTRKG